MHTPGFGRDIHNSLKSRAEMSYENLQKDKIGSVGYGSLFGGEKKISEEPDSLIIKTEKTFLGGYKRKKRRNDKKNLKKKARHIPKKYKAKL